MARFKNLYGQVVDTLGRQIATGQLPVGPMASEPLLAERYGVSRVVLREAIKALAAKGMVSVGPSIGTRVLPRDNWALLDPQVLEWHGGSDLNHATLADLVELRRIIEPEAARLAAIRATAEDLAGIRLAYLRMEAALGDGEDYVLADAGFHTAVLLASHNQFLCQLRGALQQLLRLGFSLSSRHPNAAASTLPCHEALLLCLERRDGEAAAAAVHRLIARNLGHFRGVLGEDFGRHLLPSPSDEPKNQETARHA
ncbi:FadR/GntR family transcriptional regulator [Roseomonas sp. 18066]|uniref:FadR/GntR family transcriptional regulator n=1 Tax=Roseomonas sp. 18066 TaxID=2681412 RepID=UPI00135C3C77|nr:FadR/GntR family transcriptional regulator [Roseomonas sp. 18066]